MKNLKMLYIALIALMAGVLGSCTNDPYTVGEQISGPQVYWNSSNPSTIEFKENDSKKKSLTLLRLDKDEELTVSVILDLADGVDESLFVVPETVTFKKGEGSAKLNFKVNYEQFESDKNYTVVFKLYPSDVTTSYGFSEWKVNFALNPYVLMKDSKGNNAKGKFRGASVLDGVFNINTDVEVEVDVYEHKTRPGVYKIIDPWTPTIAYGFDYPTIDEALKDGISTTNANFVIDASNPDAVIFAMQDLGIDLGYGPMAILSGYPDYMEDPAAGAGTMADGVITFPAQSLLFYSPGINVALGRNENSLLYANNTGSFRLILPGVEVADYSLGVADDGMDVTVDGVVAAKVKFTYGDDVTGIKYLIVPGNLSSEQAAEVLAVLLEGKNENILEVEDFVKGEGVANVKIGLEKAGLYTVVAAPADKDGVLRGKNAVAGLINFRGIGAQEEHPCKIVADLDAMSKYMPEYSSTYPDTTALSFAVMGEEIKEAIYLFADTATFEYFLAQGATLEELIVANGYAFEEDEVAAINDGGYAGGFINQKPNTSYTLAIYAKNVYGESTVISDTHTTEALPEIDYKGELVNGNYYMLCTMGAGTENEATFQNMFTVTPDGESGTDFVMANFGTNRVQGLSTQWKAAYDSAAGTLTLSGLEKGYEDYGSGFGVDYAYLDKEETMAIRFLSFATADSTTGADPLVLTVDPETKQITGMKNAAFIVAVVDSASGQILQYVDYFDGSLTAIIHESAIGASPASVTRAPFSSVDTNKLTVSKKLRSMKMAKLATSANSSKKSGIKTVAPTFVENYTPEKSVGFKTLKAVSVSEFRR